MHRHDDTRSLAADTILAAALAIYPSRQLPDLPPTLQLAPFHIRYRTRPTTTAPTIPPPSAPAALAFPARRLRRLRRLPAIGLCSRSPQSPSYIYRAIAVHPLRHAR